MRVYLDDRRTAPEGWTLVKTAEEAIRLLESETVEAISLDHDLGTEKTGYDVLVRIEKILFDEQIDFRVPEIFLHTANSPGRDRMLLAIQSIARLKVENDERLNFIHAGGDCLCPVCGQEYRRHPRDRVWEFLHVLCDGRRIKL